ncbi:MAG: DNA-3-methyladenine glycosylase 2 family protein, partial [Nitrospinaceae bacterium]
MQADTIPSYQTILKHFSRRDPVMHKTIRNYGPFKLRRNRNYFVVLCKAIIAQQISNSAAATITRRFNALFDGRSPTPERVSILTETKLRSVGLSRQKTAYIKDLSRQFLDKRIRPHQLTYL